MVAVTPVAEETVESQGAVPTVAALAVWIAIGENVEKIRVIKKGIIKGFLITSNYTRAGLGITGWTG